MKILMVNDYQDEIGGAEIYIFSLKQKLEEQGHQVKIFASNVTKEEYIAKLKKTAVLDYIKRIFNVRTLFSFRGMYNDFKPDIIHIHSYFNELSPSFLLATGSTPCIMTLHDERIVVAVMNQEYRNGKKCRLPVCPGCSNCVGLGGAIYEKIKSIIHTKLRKKIQLYIAPSQYIQRRVELYIGIYSIQLYNGFNLLQYRSLPFNKRLLFIGRLTKDKGVMYLLQALPTIILKHPKVHLDIVGNGDEKKNLREITKKLNLEKNVTFHATVHHKKISHFIYNADIVCIPSIGSDNLPTTCIEAMSAGRVVVASRIGGLPELVNHYKTGVLVPEKNSAEIAEHIVYLLSHQATLKSLGKAASVFIQQCNLDTHIEKIVAIYNKYV